MVLCSVTIFSIFECKYAAYKYDMMFEFVMKEIEIKVLKKIKAWLIQLVFFLISSTHNILSKLLL